MGLLEVSFSSSNVEKIEKKLSIKKKKTQRNKFTTYYSEFTFLDGHIKKHPHLKSGSIDNLK